MKTLKYLFIATLAIFAFNACEDVPEPYQIPSMGGNGTTDENVIFEQSFKSSLGSFTQTNSNPELTWINDYSSACITGHEKVNGVSTYKAGESYLVSPAIDFSTRETAYATVKHVICYSDASTIKDYHQILLSTDYAGDATKATWIKTDFVPVGSSSFTFGETSFNLPASVMGESNVHIAFLYKSTDSKASTWEVQELKISNGEAPTIEDTPAKEMTVAQAIAAHTGKATPAIVKGYIVGYIDGKSIEGAAFNKNATVATNIILADDVNETNIAKCLPIQLPSGNIRNKVNLMDNPGNYKKLVTLTGSLENYFSVPGLKSVTDAVFEGEEDNDNNEETPVTDAYINETFAKEFGTFTTAQTIGNYPWVIDYSCAKVTAYDNSSKENHAAESWLVSPAIDFSNETNAYISFDYVIRYTESGKVKEYNQLLISENYTDDVATANWSVIDYKAQENSVDWSFSNSGKVAIPAKFMGKKGIRIAFKYSASDEKAGTWEVKNVIVAKGEGEGTDAPDTPDTPDTPTGESLLANDSFENWNGTTPLNWAGSSIGHNASISQSSDAHTGSYAVLVQGATANKRLASQSYKLTKGTYTISAYIKNGDKGAGQHRIGYGIITDGKIENSNYKYITDPTPAAEEWTEVKGEFTLDSAIEVTILVMNSKVGNGAPILVDDVTLTTNDGGIAEGSDDNEGSGDENEGDEGTEGTTFTYTATTTVEPGKYIIVAGNNLLLPLDETQNYGYMKVTSVTPSNGTITTGDSNVFTLEATTGGYTIKDAYGRYVYMTGNYNSFNVSTTMPSADEATWTITFNAQGNAIIKNKYSEKTLQFDSQYNSYGAYPDERGTYPVLYKMN